MSPTVPQSLHTAGQDANAPLRVVVAGDVRLYRDGIALVLGEVSSLKVCATTSGVDSTLEAVREHHPHALVLDMAMPESLELLRRVADHDLSVVALALPEVETTFLACVEAGVASYVAREGTVADLAVAIHDAVRGELQLHPRLAGSLARRVTALSSRLDAPEREYDLTEREAEVACLIWQGKANKRIASELHIAVATVKNHVHNILRKMDATGRADIAARWSRHRLQEPPALRARHNLEHIRSRARERR